MTALVVVVTALVLVTMTTMNMDSDCRDGSSDLQNADFWVPVQTTGLQRLTRALGTLFLQALGNIFVPLEQGGDGFLN